VSGEELHAFAAALYRVPRSLTGDGVRETLRQVRETLGPAGENLAVHEVETGTPLLDWTAPREWNLTEAWLRGPDGALLAHTKDHGLSVVGYSVPTSLRLPLEELRPHLHSLPEHPDWIPYRTSYWREDWGFCLPHRVVEALRPGDYEVRIDARLEDGSLTYGEWFAPGTSSDEILLSTHICHPQLANDNLSGIVVAAALARGLDRKRRGAPRRLGVRILFVPGTIGAIAWLAQNEARVGRIRHGLVLANLGDRGRFHLKATRRGGAEVERAVAIAARDLGETLDLEAFSPFGYDERQYSSPGFDLPVASLSRSPWGRYAEYHTSADDLDFIDATALAGSLRLLDDTIDVLERNLTYRNLSPKGEPQLGRRGLYEAIGGATAGAAKDRQLALLWVLNQSDGGADLLAIAERSGLPFERLRAAADDLLGVGLLAQHSPASPAQPR
jgi:aminopeptidase-like protein